MKAILFMALILLASTLYSQEIVESRIDEFTKDTIKRTSWENISYTTTFTANFRVSKVNNQYVFDLKLIIYSKAFSIDEGKELFFKLQNGEIVTLKNQKTETTCVGCGAKGIVGMDDLGIQTTYLISKDEFQKLKNSPIETIRIYTNSSYIENSPNKKKGKKLSKALQLVG